MIVRTAPQFRLTTRHAGISIAVLLVGCWGEFGWHALPAEVQAEVWNVSQACFVLLLLAAFGWKYRGWIPWTVCGLMGGFQLTTAGCGVAWLVSPWPLVAGVSQCSQLFQFPVAIVSAFMALLVACTLQEALDGADGS